MCVLHDQHYPPPEQFPSPFKTLLYRCENPAFVLMYQPILSFLLFLSTVTQKVPQGEEIVLAAEMYQNGQKYSCRPTKQ